MAEASQDLIKVMQGRGATMLVEIHGQAAFAPHADLMRWKRRLSASVLSLAGTYAPSNKRPRWAHSGKGLKTSMRASTLDTELSAGGGSVRSSVGSVSPHAVFVDQGTGIHGMGNGPYQGKILPPWTRGSPSLFESTWRPGPGQPPVGTTTIRGQEPQYFMDRALEEALRRSGMVTVNVPDSAISAATAENLFTTTFGGVPQFEGSAAFGMELAMWRRWRDAAWNKNHSLGEGEALTRHITHRIAERDRRLAAQAVFKEIRTEIRSGLRRRKRKAREAGYTKDLKKTATKKKPTKKIKKTVADMPASLKAMMNRDIERFLARHPGRYTRVPGFSSTHFTVRDKNGNTHPVEWSVGVSSRIYDFFD